MLAALIIIFAVIADQVSKYIVDQNLPNVGDSAEFINGFMRFQRANNEGGGWSMLDGGGWERALLMSVSLVAMVIVVYILIKFYKRHCLLNVALSMVLGGAIGNMIDRFRLTFVIDFFKTEFIDFPTFNVADSFITVGAILLVVYVIFFDAKVEARIKAEKEASESVELTENETSEEAENDEVEPETEEAIVPEETVDE